MFFSNFCLSNCWSPNMMHEHSWKRYSHLFEHSSCSQVLPVSCLHTLNAHPWKSALIYYHFVSKTSVEHRDLTVRTPYVGGSTSWFCEVSTFNLCTTKQVMYRWLLLRNCKAPSAPQTSVTSRIYSKKKKRKTHMRYM